MKKKVLIIGGILLLSSLLIFKEDKNTKEVLVKDNIDIKGTIALYKSDDKTNYTEITEIPESGYIVNEDKSYCTTDNKTKVKGKIKTIDGNTIITNISKNDKCYVWFDKEIKIGDTIIANLGTSIKTTTPTFTNVATTDEGVYAVEDGMYGGTSYYWRGAVTNNYVKFAGFCWRIVRINGDGTIRLIYDGSTCHANGTSTAESIASGYASVAYNSKYDASYYVGWTQNGTQRTTSGTASNAKTQLESWYSSNVTGANAQKVAQGKYCNDRDVGQPLSSWSGYVTTWSATGTSFAYAGLKRLYETYAPTLSCPTGDVYQLSVGLITADEVEFAGGRDINNTSYYLYNGQHYWTMSPYYWISSGAAYVFVVNTSGYLGYYSVNWTGIGLRPVINLKSDVTFSSGNGTQNSPYIVE